MRNFIRNFKSKSLMTIKKQKKLNWGEKSKNLKYDENLF